MPLLTKVMQGDDEELADKVRTALRLPQTLRKRSEVPRDRLGLEAKTLANKSLDAGYLKDAVKYLNAAHENDPLDFEVMLKLGRTHNVMKDDQTAVRWFDLARKSPDPDIATEAKQSFTNLYGPLARFRTTVWMLPFYSSRWRDVFSYGQLKTEIKMKQLPLRPYISVRFIGDTRGELRGGWQPQALSESAFIIGGGLSTKSWQGITAWFEAGAAVRYRRAAQNTGLGDLRGGFSFARGIGNLMRKESHGLFAETNDDGVFISRFQNDFLLYSQNRAGWTFSDKLQLLWNWNATIDTKRQYWANFIEAGPGARFRLPSMPFLFTVNALRGSYLVNEGNPRGPVYYELRAGFWYAYTL
jgi:hypothetical protein